MKRGTEGFIKPFFQFFILTFLTFAGANFVEAAQANCPIPPNPGQCICHNINGGSGEVCPSPNGIVGGHNDHITCYNNGGVGCSVEDRCGKCSGCGDGVLIQGEECDDGNNVSGDGCDADCKIECKSDAECNDNNACTNDVCSLNTFHCVHENNADSCDDNNPCTEGDVCSGGQCAAGSPKSCSDGIECTTDSCDVNSGLCSNDSVGCECNQNSDCEDNDPCTDDVCNAQKSCEHNPNTGNSCEDGTFCNGADVCEAGQCVHEGDPCLGGNECNNACNEDANNCSNTEGTSCSDDGNLCTDNVCNGNGECVSVNNHAACDDGNACTNEDVCNGGSCSPGTPKSCSDGIECTTDSCNVDTGECSSDGAGCECAQDADCDDRDPCTDDTCNDQRTCEHSPNTGNSCENGIYCDGEDVCNDGQCVHAGDPCAAGAECNNVCNEDNDSCAVSVGSSCSDDGNPCTDNQCDGDGNCVALNNKADCSDGDECTDGDVCENGACVSGLAKQCNDARACSTDTCDAKTGECTFNLSACECAQDADCNDRNPCTTDICTADGKCQNQVIVGTVECPAPSVCGNGLLEKGEQCDDGNISEEDACSNTCEVLTVTEASPAIGTTPTAGLADNLEGQGGCMLSATAASNPVLYLLYAFTLGALSILRRKTK